MPKATKSDFLYAGNLAIAAQGKTFEEVEAKLESALNSMSTYYKNYLLKPNPSKCQCVPHPADQTQTKCCMHEHTDKPVCPITLDRYLIYKHHCEKIPQKVTARNNIFRKLINSKWGTKPESRSAHAGSVDVSFNEIYRLVTGSMRAIPFYQAVGLSSPSSCGEARIQREILPDLQQSPLRL
ncbi:hypothetical protein Trydic_g12189 [Trypoxylus dichotomus]